MANPGTSVGLGPLPPGTQVGSWRVVEGENVLVTTEGHGYLIDFGVGDFQGASTLTVE